MVYVSHTSQYLLFQSVRNFCGRLVLNSQNLDTCQSLSCSQFEKLIFNMLSMRNHHVYCLKVIWTSLLFWLVTWAYITKRTQHLSHPELLGNKQLPSTGTRNDTGVFPPQQMDQRVPAPAQPQSPPGLQQYVCFSQMLLWLEFTKLPWIVCPEHKSIVRQKITPMFSLGTDPSLCQCLCFSNTVQTVSSSQFLFTTAIPFQKENIKALGWQIMYHHSY